MLAGSHMQSRMQPPPCGSDRPTLGLTKNYQVQAVGEMEL